MRIKKPSLPEWKEWANEELASLYFARAAVLMDEALSPKRKRNTYQPPRSLTLLEGNKASTSKEN
jgi:hypothetical protein